MNLAKVSTSHSGRKIVPIFFRATARCGACFGRPRGGWRILELPAASAVVTGDSGVVPCSKHGANEELVYELC